MNRLLPLLVVALLVGPARAQTPASPAPPDYLMFADVPWGSPPDFVIGLFNMLQLTHLSTIPEGDMMFRRHMEGLGDVTVWAIMAPGKGLVRVYTSTIVPEDKVLPYYQQMLDRLTRQYGPPAELVHTYEAPYTEGDGRTLEALLKKKAHLSATWHSSGSPPDVMRISVSPSHTLDQTYDSPDWPAELARRKAIAPAPAPAGPY